MSRSGSQTTLVAAIAGGKLGISSGKIELAAGSKVVSRRKRREFDDGHEKNTILSVTESKESKGSLLKRKRKRVAGYLREDFPEHSLATKVSLADKYSLGLIRRDVVSTVPLLKKKKKKRKKKKRRKKLDKMKKDIEARAQRIALLTSSTYRAQVMLDMMKGNDLENMKSPRRPLRGSSSTLAKGRARKSLGVVDLASTRREEEEEEEEEEDQEGEKIKKKEEKAGDCMNARRPMLDSQHDLISAGQTALAIISDNQHGQKQEKLHQQQQQQLVQQQSSSPLLKRVMYSIDDVGESRMNKMPAAEQRIHERLAEIVSPGAVEGFFRYVDALQAAQREKLMSKIRDRRFAGCCHIEYNRLAVHKPAVVFAEEVAARRVARSLKREQGVQRARDKKHMFDMNKSERLQQLLARQRTTSEKRAARELLERSASAWYSSVLFCKYACDMKRVLDSLQWRKVLRFKATLIQRNVRIFLARRGAGRLRRAIRVIKRFCIEHFVPKRFGIEKRAARLLGSFLLDNQKNVLQIIRDWRRRVVRCQRIARGFIECTAARQTALSKMWAIHERRLSNLARRERRRSLENHGKRLKSESLELRHSSFQKQMVNNWLRGVVVPSGVNIPTMDGRLYFPVGVHHQQQQKQLEEERGVESDYHERQNRNVQHVMDIYLNDEFRSKLEQERAKPLILAPVPRAERNRILRQVIENARYEHRARATESKLEHQEVIKSQMTVGVDEARQVLRDDKGAVAATKKLTTIQFRYPVVPLYSKITSAEMFALVQEAQVKIRRSPSLTKIIKEIKN